METSYFMDLTTPPDNENLKIAIGNLFTDWMSIRDFTFEKYPTAIEEWHVSVKKYGWSYRIKDKKRAIIYLSPRTGYFIVTMVFGQKATDMIISSNISENTKTELMNSKVYIEGRVLRLDFHNNLILSDIKKLIEIKIAN
jgi:Protein of unknown function (DUF3788)